MISNTELFKKFIGFKYDDKIIEEYDGIALNIKPKTNEFQIFLYGEEYFGLTIFDKSDNVFTMAKNNFIFEVHKPKYSNDKACSISINENIFMDMIDLFLEHNYQKMYDNIEYLFLLS